MCIFYQLFHRSGKRYHQQRVFAGAHLSEHGPLPGLGASPYTSDHVLFRALVLCAGSFYFYRAEWSQSHDTVPRHPVCVWAVHWLHIPCMVSRFRI